MKLQSRWPEFDGETEILTSQLSLTRKYNLRYRLLLICKLNLCKFLCPPWSRGYDSAFSLRRPDSIPGGGELFRYLLQNIQQEPLFQEFSANHLHAKFVKNSYLL
jgi:hypothetical protein